MDNLRAERERKQTEGLLERREDRTIRKAVEVAGRICDDSKKRADRKLGRSL